MDKLVKREFNQDTLSGISCSNGQVLVYNMALAIKGCGTDTDTTLTASESASDELVVSGLALQAGATIDGSPIVTEATLPDYIVNPGCSDNETLKYDGDAGLGHVPKFINFFQTHNS